MRTRPVWTVAQQFHWQQPPPPPTLKPFPLARTRTGPSLAQGRQPERDNDNVYMLITCENMQQTSQPRRGSLQFAMRYTFSHQLKLPEQGMREPKPSPNLTTTWPIVVCALQSEPAVCACVCVCAGILITTATTMPATTNGSSNNNNSRTDVPYASVDEAL